MSTVSHSRLHFPGLFKLQGCDHVASGNGRYGMVYITIKHGNKCTIQSCLAHISLLFQECHQVCVMCAANYPQPRGSVKCVKCEV